MMKKTAALLLVMCLSLALLVGCKSEEPEIQASEGLSYDTLSETTCLVSGRGSCTDEALIIPETSPAGKSVIGIAPYAFQNDTTVTSVSLPKGAVEIGAYAFAGCEGLTYFQLPDKFERVGVYAFSRCTALTRFYLGSALTHVGDGAFSGCNAMQYAFFRGGDDAWKKVDVGNNNSALTMNLYLYSTSRPESGRFWYYSGGSIRIW